MVAEHEAATKLATVLGPRYRFVALRTAFISLISHVFSHRPGGYTRVLRTGYRRGDHAEMAYLELVDRPGELSPATPVNEELVLKYKSASDANREHFRSLGLIRKN